MSLKSMFQSAVNAVKFMFSPEQQNREDDKDDDITVIHASEAYAKVDTAMKAPVSKEAAVKEVKPAVVAKKPRKPRAPKAPEAK